MKKLVQITDLLLECVNSAIAELPQDDQFSATSETLLLAEGSSIDSLQLVSIVVDFEEALSSKLNVVVCLTTDEAMMQAESPFYSVKTLSEYAFKLLPV
jgi:acyl carrier protein